MAETTLRLSRQIVGVAVIGLALLLFLAWRTEVIADRTALAVWENCTSYSQEIAAYNQGLKTAADSGLFASTFTPEQQQALDSLANNLQIPLPDCGPRPS